MTTAADLIVIGGGAGGLTAAREGVRRGARTVLVQDGAPGGDCTFTGCVPSKTLLAAGERNEFRQRFDHMAIPWVTYTDPEVAHVGMTEQHAVSHGGRVACWVRRSWRRGRGR